MKKYFIHNDSAPLGPYTINELKEMEITKYTPVWCEGLEGWTPAAQVKELESLWSEDQPFIYYAAPPPVFDKDVYENVVKNGIPSAPASTNKSRIGSPAFWIGLSIMAVALIGLLAYRYHSKTVDQTYIAALEQRKWEDSINKQVDTTKQYTQLVDSNGSIADTAYDVDRSENAKNYARMNIERFVRCAKSFEVKRLGGIADTRIVFYNNSEFPIDRASFKVTYIKSNGDVFTTHNVSIGAIPPHGRKEISAPDEKRGTDIRCTLIKISSSSLGLAKNVAISF